MQFRGKLLKKRGEPHRGSPHLYCAKDWKHYRSTRPLTSSTSSPHTHNQEIASEVSALENSGADDALFVVRQHVATPENEPASPPSSLDERNCSQDQLIQQQPPLSRVPELLDVNLLTAPFGSSDPFAFYGAFGVARDATVDAIREECKKLALHYHPDMCAETEPEQSSRAAGRCGSTSWTWNGESN
jgi:hypothetical protein